MSVELDLSRKPAAAAATPNLAGLGREGLRQAMIAAGVEEKKARMRAARISARHCSHSSSPLLFSAQMAACKCTRWTG